MVHSLAIDVRRVTSAHFKQIRALTVSILLKKRDLRQEFVFKTEDRGAGCVNRLPVIIRSCDRIESIHEKTIGKQRG